MCSLLAVFLSDLQETLGMACSRSEFGLKYYRLRRFPNEAVKQLAFHWIEGIYEKTWLPEEIIFICCSQQKMLCCKSHPRHLDKGNVHFCFNKRNVKKRTSIKILLSYHQWRLTTSLTYAYWPWTYSNNFSCFSWFSKCCTSCPVPIGSFAFSWGNLTNHVNVC